MEKQAIRMRIIKFFAWFGIGCLVMSMIRVSQMGHYNPLDEPIARLALIIGLVSYGLSRILRRIW